MLRLRPLAVLYLVLMLALTVQGWARLWHQQGMPTGNALAMSFCSATANASLTRQLPALPSAHEQCPDCTVAVAFGDAPPVWPWITPRQYQAAYALALLIPIAPPQSLPRDRLAPPRAPPALV